MKLKRNMYLKNLVRTKKCLMLSITQLSENIMIIQTISKTKDETGSIAIKEFVGLKLNMYSYLVDDTSKH